MAKALILALGLFLCFSPGVGAKNGITVLDYSDSSVWGDAIPAGIKAWNDVPGVNFRYKRMSGRCPQWKNVKAGAVFICSETMNYMGGTLPHMHVIKITLSDQAHLRQPEERAGTICHELGHALGLNAHYPQGSPTCRADGSPAGTPQAWDIRDWNARHAADRKDNAQAKAHAADRRHRQPGK